MFQPLPVVGPASPATRSIITIQKAKVKDQRLSCEFTEQRTDEAPPRTFALACTEEVHPDLLHALSRLVPHLCLLTEQLTESRDFWPDEAEALPALFEPFRVTGFALARHQGGVTLTGQRQLAGGRILNLNTPYQSFDDELNDYAYVGLLETTVQTGAAEVEAGLRGKCTEYRQLALFEPEGFTTADVPIIPLTPRA